jgi:hypothetical protein
MEISFRNRVLVGVFATVIVVGSGVATALVTSGDAPVGSAADTSTSTGGSVDTTTPSTPDATTPTAPNGTDDDESASDGTSEAGAVFWDPAQCGGDEVMNHGHYVASQPKGGESRSTAAQSDCGKPLSSIADDGDEGDEGDESGDAPEVEAPDADGAPSPSAEHGNPNAPGHNK